MNDACPCTNHHDAVKCPECKLSIFNWERNQIPLDEHKRRSPQCLFIKRFGSIVDEYTPSKEEIIGIWNEDPLIKSILSSGNYIKEEVNKVLFDRLNKHYTPFRNIDEFNSYFFKYKKSLISIDLPENKTLKDFVCKFCRKLNISFTLVPCGHMICSDCISLNKSCNICGINIMKFHKCYFV